MRNKFYVVLAALGCFFTASPAAQPSQCDATTIKHTDKTVTDVICDPIQGELYIKHVQKKRAILLESRNKKLHYQLIKLERNADPSLVGEEESIAFITPQILRLQNKQYLGLTIAERSTRGNGMGQCGGGSEIYFVSLEIVKSKVVERNRFLIYSCLKDIYLADDGSGKRDAIKMDANNEIIFKWLNYPGYENPITGKYSFTANQLSMPEKKNN
jgi:hypothetical protein